MTTSTWQPPARRRIYLLRHGDVSYFEQAGKPFAPHAVPLNDSGRQQAAATAEALAALPLDKALCSGLPRTLQTAEIVAAPHGLSVAIEPAFREVEAGKLRELPLGNAEQAFVGAFNAKIDRNTSFLGGETFGALQERVLPAFERLLADDSWKHALLVAHGVVNRTILAHLLGMGVGSFGTIEQDPCCVNMIDVIDGGRFIVRLMNHSCYNAVKRGLELTSMERLFLEFRSL